MNKAEEKALELIPQHPNEVIEKRRGAMRTIYVAGYEQAEKDLAFTHITPTDDEKQAAVHYMEDCEEVDDFVRRNIDEIAERYFVSGAKWKEKELGTYKWSEKDQRYFEAVKRAIVSCTSGIEGVDGKETQLIEWLSRLFRRKYYRKSKYPFFKGWVARDKDGELRVFEYIPERDGDVWVSDTDSRCISPKYFPELTWESEPMEVELIIKSKEENK